MSEQIQVVNVFGPGSQPSEQDGALLQYPIMPSEMSTYRPPEMPSLEGFGGTRAALDWLARALDACVVEGRSAIASLDGLGPDDRNLLNQVLGEGEVSVRLHAQPGARSQESILAGVWRSLYVDEHGRMLHDLLEVGAAPEYLELASQPRVEAFAAPPPGPQAINAPPIVTELIDRSANCRPGDLPHVLNLTLLPMTDEDLAYLDAALGMGPVDALSRSYGRCHIQSTLLPNVWWVRYFNSMQKLILNTIEVVSVPAVLCAAPEDLRDSRERLAALLEPYATDLTDD